MDSYFVQKQQFEVKTTSMMNLFLTNMQIFTSQDINLWTGLLSFWRHPFTAEHPLVNKWCNAPNLFWWKNKLIYILNGLRLRTFPANVHSFRHCIKPDLWPIFGQQCTRLETLSLGICINFHNLKTHAEISYVQSQITGHTVTSAAE